MPAQPLNSTLRDLIRPDGVASMLCDGRELLRRIFVTVRDSRWAEITPSQWESSVDESTGTATLSARHINPRVAFEWKATLSVSRDLRELRFAIKGKALREMELCRLGLVILHPVDTMVGSRLVAAGSVAAREAELRPNTEQRLIVPEQISPQPIIDGIPVAMTEPFSELLIEREDLGALTFRFEGDLFELEDQRNWGDASFKTYCTPLRLGFPRRVEAGALIEQSVEVRFEPATAQVVARPSNERLGLFPSVARQWSLSSHSSDTSAPLASNATQPAWHGLNFEVEIGIEPDLTPTAEVLKSLSMFEGRIARVVVYGQNTHPPEPTSVNLWRKALNTTPSIPIFVGTHGYYVEFNRAKRLDLSASGLAFPLTATVHSDDAETIADNVSTIVAMAETARNLTGCNEIVISPLALYHPPITGPLRFPRDLVRPWLTAMLIHAAAARIKSITLADDILEAINLDEPRTLLFVSRLLDCAGLEVVLLDTPQSLGLHAAELRRPGRCAHQILAANLSPQSATLSSPRAGEVTIPAFGAVWIELA